MHRAFLLLVLARAGAPTGPPGECEVPSWWYADEAARSSEDDALAALEARWSARRAACPISGAHTLACPPGAVLVDAWVEARTNGTTKVLAPAPFDVYGCFGGDQCRLPTAHVCAGASAPSNVSTTVAISGECATSEAVREASIAQAGAPSPASAPAATGEQDEADDHIIPLFEWKERMLARLAEQATHHATQHEGAAEGGAQAGEVNGGPAAAEGTDGAPTADAGAQNATGRPTAPPAGAATLPPSGPARIRLPLSQRFNYGSFDAGARLVTANPEAKGANDILRADKDKCAHRARRGSRVTTARACELARPQALALGSRHLVHAAAGRAPAAARRYMLSPCAARKWVVIALPEDIKVDAISLSNRELFSSSVREFQLLGSMKYPTDLWFELGKFEAQDTKHVRAERGAGGGRARGGRGVSPSTVSCAARAHAPHARPPRRAVPHDNCRAPRASARAGPRVLHEHAQLGAVPQAEADLAPPRRALLHALERRDLRADGDGRLQRVDGAAGAADGGDAAAHDERGLGRRGRGRGGAGGGGGGGACGGGGGSGQCHRAHGCRGRGAAHGRGRRWHGQLGLS